MQVIAAALSRDHSEDAAGLWGRRGDPQRHRRPRRPRSCAWEAGSRGNPPRGNPRRRRSAPHLGLDPQPRLKTALGWTSGQIDDEPWLEVRDLLDYWTDNPPVHEILKVVHKIEAKKPDPKPKGMSIADLRRQFPNGVMRGRG